MAPPSGHLIERAAERMRAESGLPDLSDDGSAGARRLDPRDAISRARDLDDAAAPMVPAGLTLPIPGLSAQRPSDAAGAATMDGDADFEPAARILEMAMLERAGLVVGRKSRTRISEEFRIAVGQVLRALQSSYATGHGSANLVMVTSSRPGEGKSFTAMNLAGCIAQQSQRDVMLVDIDAKQRPVTYELGLGDVPGLLDLVRDSSLRVEDVIIPTAIPNLSILPIGTRLQSNGEMPLSRPISAIVERLGRRFANRIIILDAPPCLSTSDPSALAPVVGQILMVVEAERTQRNELVAALDLVRVCPTITLLLNKIQLTTSYTFGAYHYFGTYS